MADRDAFLAAIIADRASDTPRLIYSDWLEEHGEGERAEFIRVQCELARLDCHHGPDAGPTPWCKTCVQRQAPRRRERSLLNAHGRAWHNLPACLDWCIWNRREHEWFFADNGGLALYRRGFVSEITCSWEDWAAHHEAITRATPLERVTLMTWPPVEEIGEEWYRLPGQVRIWRFDELADGAASLRHDELTSRLLEKTWDRIKFTLPQHPQDENDILEGVREIMDIYEAWLDEQRIAHRTSRRAIGTATGMIAPGPGEPG